MLSGAEQEINLQQLDYHGIALLALQHSDLPFDLRAQLKARQAMLVANEALKREALRELSAACSAAQQSPILFKGTALAYQQYPQPWLRPRTDVDLFIDPQVKPQLETLLQDIDFEKLFAIEGDFVSYQSTYAKALTDKVALNLDLHWRISNRQILASCFSYEELFTSAEEIPALGLSAPSRVHQLLIACLHRLGHHNKEERLAWLYDIHLLTRQLPANEWRAVAQLAERKGIACLTLDALSLCTALFATEVPEHITAALQTAADKGEAAAIFLQRELPEWRVFSHELRAVRGFSNKIRLLREHLFPSSAYMRERTDQHNLLAAHLQRWRRGLRRIIEP